MMLTTSEVKLWSMHSGRRHHTFELPREAQHPVPGGNCLAEASCQASCKLAFSWAHALAVSWQPSNSACPSSSLAPRLDSSTWQEAAHAGIVCRVQLPLGVTARSPDRAGQALFSKRHTQSQRSRHQQVAHRWLHAGRPLEQTLGPGHPESG